MTDQSHLTTAPRISKRLVRNSSRLIASQRLQRQRYWINLWALSLAYFSILFGLIWLIWILYTTFSWGIQGLSWAVFTEMTPPPNASDGGLANAIAGSLLIVGLATCIGTPIGIFAGIYLAEYAHNNWFAQIIRFINDILLSAPSIVIGLFVYALVVTHMGNFSALAGAFSLALLQIPIVIRTTENTLRLIPDTLREAAFALGAPKWKVIFSITIKASYTGIITGVLLAIARVTGETAPLLFTALSNQFWSVDLFQPMANLPVTIFKFAMSPFIQWQQLAWAGVFLITLGVLSLNLICRWLFNQHKSEL